MQDTNDGLMLTKYEATGAQQTKTRENRPARSLRGGQVKPMSTVSRLLWKHHALDIYR